MSAAAWRRCEKQFPRNPNSKKGEINCVFYSRYSWLRKFPGKGDSSLQSWNIKCPEKSSPLSVPLHICRGCENLIHGKRNYAWWKKSILTNLYIDHLIMVLCTNTGCPKNGLLGTFGHDGHFWAVLGTSFSSYGYCPNCQKMPKFLSGTFFFDTLYNGEIILTHS